MLTNRFPVKYINDVMKTDTPHEFRVTVLGRWSRFYT